MKYRIDHDLHIHSQLSSCSNHPEQTNERILRYAEENGLSTVVETNHFWDSSDVDGASKWYLPQDYDHLAQALPLPQREGIRFLFGCETDLDRNLTLGISPRRMEQFDFIIIPTTHLHMAGFTIDGTAGAEERARAYVERLDAVLSMDLPFHKIGIAHLACRLIWRDQPFEEVLKRISTDEFARLFRRAAALGVGIELNAGDFASARTEEQQAQTLRVFSTALECGCKFYLGGDIHKPEGFASCARRFARAIDALDLTEADKFVI